MVLQSQARGRENSFFPCCSGASGSFRVVVVSLGGSPSPARSHPETAACARASVQVHMGRVPSKAHDNLHNMVLEQAVPSRCVEALQHMYIHGDVYCLKRKFVHLIQI